MINSLTGIRAFAAFAVFLFHASVVRVGGQRINVDFLDGFIIHNGDFGVDIFFVLSGYVITLAYGRRFMFFTSAEYGAFIYARLIRLLPIHLVTMTLMIIAFEYSRDKLGGRTENEFNFEFRSVFFSALMVHEWMSSNNFLINFIPLRALVGVLGRIGSPNSVSWSVSAEFFAYVLFPVIFKFIKIRRDFSLFLLSCFGFYFIAEKLIPLDGLLRVLFCFSIGVWVRFYSLYPMLKLKQVEKWIGSACLLVLLILMDKFRMAEGGVPYFMAVIFTSLLIGAVVCKNDWLGGVFSAKWVVYFGEISYSFYMIHWFCLKFIYGVLSLNTNFSQVRAVVYVVLSLIVSLFFSGLMYKYIEDPVRNLLRIRNT